jgi:hypothetical protein
LILRFPTRRFNLRQSSAQEQEMAHVEWNMWNDLIYDAIMNGDRDFVPYWRMRREMAQERWERARDRRMVAERHS